MIFFFDGSPADEVCGNGKAAVGGPLTMDPELRKENYYSVVSLSSVPSDIRSFLFPQLPLDRNKDPEAHS
jgi:hypothetical protein